MLPLILFLILSVCSMGWALYSKLQRQRALPREQRQYAELFTLSLYAIAVLINALLVYQFTAQGLSVGEHLFQMVSCCTIIPLVYMHFSWQVSKQMKNTTTLVLWLLCLLLLFTNVTLYNPFSPYEPSHFTPRHPFALYVVSHGEKLWAIYTGDLIIILQAIVTMLRIVPFAYTLRENGLRFSKSVYAFFVWWLLSAVYVVAVSSLNMEQLTSTAGTWIYYMGMTISIVSINALFACNYDRHPVETEKGEVVENVDTYLDNLYADLSRQMEEIMEREQVFRRPGYTVEDMCELLHTDRKLLAQMMMHRYGIHFPEYLNKRRIEYAQQLLLTTQMKIAQVAEESGFASSSHLNRLFRQHLGCSPSQWFKEHRS